MSKRFPLSAGEIAALGGYASIAFSIAFETTKDWRSALLVALGAFCMVLVFSMSLKLWRRRATQFTLFKKIPEEGLAFRYVRTAQRDVMVTHFSGGVPAEASIQLMLSKLKQGVSITRIVGVRPGAEPELSAWLSKFTDQPGYKEHRISGPCFPPCDFIIIDGRTVLLYLPATPNSIEFERAIVFRNSSVAEGFSAAFYRLIEERGKLDARFAPAPVPA